MRSDADVMLQFIDASPAVPSLFAGWVRDCLCAYRIDGCYIGEGDELCSEAALEKGLTPRESEILPYLVKGYDRGFIASELTISVETVRSHTRHIYGKFDVHTRVELLNAIALRGCDD